MSQEIPKIITIVRKGSFQTTSNSNTQCVEKGHARYRYEAILRFRCTQKDLDNNGFLVDHNDINRLIISFCTKVSIRSCELLAIDLCDYLVLSIRNLIGLKLSIFSYIQEKADTAHIEVEWNE